MSWFASSSTPNQTGNQDGTPFTTSSGGYPTATVPLLTGLDVTTPEITATGQVTATGQTIVLPGQPTMVVTGDGGIVDPGTVNSAAVPIPADTSSGSQNNPSQRLAGQLYSNDTGGSDTNNGVSFAIADASVEDNLLVQDPFAASAPGGQGAIALEYRLDHDVLAEPGLGAVIINDGLQDVLDYDGASADMTAAVDALKDMATQLQAFGVPTDGVVIGSLTPCGGYTDSTASHACDTAAENGRLTINSDISLLATPEADFNAAISSGSGPETVATADGDGDGANLSAEGYAGLAAMVYAQVTPFPASASVFPPSP
jgi:hypothetical protein